MQGRKELQTKMFYQIHLNNLVAIDNFYRRLSEVLDLNFLYDAKSRYYGEKVQWSIDLVVLSS